MMKRRTLLIAAALALSIALLMPPLPVSLKTYDYVFMVDITRSMNTEDYSDSAGSAISRLEKTRREMLHAVRALPCGSRVGLGVFTERMPALLFSPIEVCEDYPVLQASIRHLDWRMAWVADSNIGQALYNSLSLMQRPLLKDSRLVFFTDGHEAPPINPRYAPDFSDLLPQDREAAWRFGLIVGVGQPGLSRIPKYDEDGMQIGYYEAEDVPHASRFGLPEDPTRIEGYVPRNAPWGTQQVLGTEHLSGVRHDYLRSLAEQTAMDYHPLQSGAELAAALKQDVFARRQRHPTRMSFVPAGLGLLLLVMCLHPWRQKWPPHAYQGISAENR